PSPVWSIPNVARTRQKMDSQSGVSRVGSGKKGCQSGSARESGRIGLACVPFCLIARLRCCCCCCCFSPLSNYQIHPFHLEGERGHWYQKCCLIDLGTELIKLLCMSQWQ